MRDYKEEDYLMISGIQHFSFCRRQWALIHVEQLWSENVRTVEGNIMHERAHDGKLVEKRNNIIVARGMNIFSKTMGVSGCCDVVEFHKEGNGIQLHGYEGEYGVYPIEYKKGKAKENDADILQLTAQALCLEEMLSCNITEGALYYGETKRRLKIQFTEERREKVKAIFLEMHQYFERRYTPKVKFSKSCNACSLKELCIPILGKQRSIEKYIEKYLRDEE